MIQLFGAPNGLCSSITESKHIKAIKEPWRRSNWYEALEQMLLSNQHLNKLEAVCALFIARNMFTTNFHLTEGILPRPTPILPTPTPPTASSSNGAITPVIVTDDNDPHNEQEARPHDGPKVTAEVFLARTPGM